MLSKLGKKSAIFASAATLVIAPLIVTSMTAQAEPESSAQTLLTCNLSGKADFSPALGLNPAGQSTEMAVQGQATDCQGDVDVASATFEGALSGQMSCTSLPRDVGGQVDITWKAADGSTTTSKATFNLAMEGDLSNPTNPITGQFTGENTEGSFSGAKHNGEAKINPASVAGGCLTGGVQSMEFDGEYSLGA